MTERESAMLNRTSLLLGSDVMERMTDTRVIIFGVGGVGSWCAESLVRSGIGHLTMVDSDLVSESNLNRQLMATRDTVGKAKVEALQERLLSINPDANVEGLQQVFSKETADSFDLNSYDYVVDAIDSLDCKAYLIRTACESRATLFSSMGAALKLDPQQIQVAEFWKVKGCPLARALRNKFKHSKQLPSKKFQCVYSEELLSNRGCLQEEAPDTWTPLKAQVNGTVCHAVAMFGLTLAGLIVQDIYNKSIIQC